MRLRFHIPRGSKSLMWEIWSTEYPSWTGSVVDFRFAQIWECFLILYHWKKSLIWNVKNFKIWWNFMLGRLNLSLAGYFVQVIIFSVEREFAPTDRKVLTESPSSTDWSLLHWLLIICMGMTVCNSNCCLPGLEHASPSYLPASSYPSPSAHVHGTGLFFIDLWRHSFSSFDQFDLSQLLESPCFGIPPNYVVFHSP